MRNYNQTTEVRNLFSGILVGSAATTPTWLGNSVDTINFQDLLAVLCLGSLSGSGATDRAMDVTVKLQECATANGTFLDITAGACNGTASVYGSAKFDVVQLVAGSANAQSPFKSRKLYLKINDGTHKRYIRPHIGVVGTAASILDCTCSVAVVLSRPRQSEYIQDSIAVTTTDAFVTWGVANSSIPGV